MAISWLSALKVVPWDKVMEHAPGVLEKARGLMDKHRGTSASGTATADPQHAEEVPSLGELKNRCLGLQAQVDQLTQTQQQMAQSMAELAEQQAGLIAMVKRLKSQLKWLIAGLVLGVLGCVALFFMK